jgi:site-specific DNA-methyltransferase (adenine-specific)
MKESKDILSLFEALNNHEIFTPPRVARQMLDLVPIEVWQNPHVRLLDPCTKSGVFLREAFYRFYDGLSKLTTHVGHDGKTYDLSVPQQRINHILRNMLYGIATSELTAYVARRTLYGVMHANVDKQISALDSFEESTNFHKWTEQEKSNFIGRNKFNEYFDHKLFCTDDYKGFEPEGNIFYPNNEVQKIVIDTDDYTIEDKYFPFIDDRTQHQKILDIRGGKMKFDVIVGNPPYQVSGGSGGTSDASVYHFFVEHAKKLKPEHLSMIIPSRWLTGGRGMSSFRADMLGDKKLKILVDYPVSKDIFSNVEVKGGICYFYWSPSNVDSCNVSIVRDGRAVQSIRKLDEFDVFVRDAVGLDILHKVIGMDGTSIIANLTADTPFGLATNFNDFADSKRHGDAALHYIKKGIRKTGFIDSGYIIKNSELINKWKVLIPEAGSDGGKKIPDSVLGKPLISSPPSVCTQSYLAYWLDSEMEAESFNSYVKTKFFRYIVSLRKLTQHALRSTYLWVPMQKWDRIWVDEILYEKYALTKDQISHIESVIREME